MQDYWTADTAGRCAGVTRPNVRIEYTTSQTQLCRNDILRVVDNLTGIFTGSCGIGEFRQLQRKADPA